MANTTSNIVSNAQSKMVSNVVSNYAYMSTYSLANITSYYPDTLPQVSQYTTELQKAQSKLGSNQDISSNLTTLASYINQIDMQTKSLGEINAVFISKTPEYQNKTATSDFLSNIQSVSTQTQTLQTQIEVVNANLQNTDIKLSGDITGILFYTYTTATIILGILSIGLITYSIYMVMTEPDIIDMVPFQLLRGGTRRS
jgi:hypothetical protein